MNAAGYAENEYNGPCDALSIMENKNSGNEKLKKRSSSLSEKRQNETLSRK